MDDETFGLAGVRPQVRMGLVDDLSRLDILDEEIILKELKQRYEDQKYYTFLGDVLVAVNPFRELPIYSVQHHDIYNDHESSPRSPHVFWMAQQAYRSLLDSKRDQCILVSGESGAGKTESTKLIIRHLAYMSSESDNALHEMIVQVNPLLEAFGNAQTIMNNNSSRFGKYVELLFRENGQISGARIHDYLLEKSRVVYRGAGERNFHIFYYLFAGMSEDQLLYYYLEEPNLYRIMQTTTNRDPLSSNRSYFREKFLEQIDIMKLVGFTEDDISTVFTLLSAILHLTNIAFVEDPETDGVQIDDEYPLRVVVNLLCVDIQELTSALISNVIYVKGEKVETLKKISQAEDGRDALAKALYARLFGWIVAQINYHIQPQTKDGIDGPTIGILDMSGFEQFPQNSFEQICINAANERLQKFFNENIFALEQKDYENEGIDLNTVVFKSNEPLIDLFFKKPTGVFHIIDEESTFPQATDATLVQKLNYLCSSSPYYKKAQGDQSVFTIQHYAGEVNYNADGFLEKNRDSLSQTLVDCLVSSTNDVVGALFLACLSDTGSISGTVTSRSTRSRSSLFRSRVCRSESSDSISKATAKRVRSRQSLKSSSESIFSVVTSASDFKHQSTMSKQFMRSLADLMKKMSKAKPWFIRCIRPHKELRAGPFIPDIVMEQLRCNGLMEIAKIRRDGFAIRMTPAELVERFKVVSFEPEEDIQPTYDNVKSILKDAGVEGHAYGKTKLFLRYWHGPMLQKKAHQRWQEIKVKREAERAKQEAERVKREAEQSPASEQESEPHIPAMFTIAPAPQENEDARSSDSESSSERIQEWIKQNEQIMMQRTLPHDSPPPPFVPPAKPHVSHRATLSGHDVTEKKVLDPRMWDRFQMIPRERVTASESFEPILRLFKVICYILLFFLVLGSAVVSKVTILLLASGLQEKASSEKQDATKTMLVIMVCFPYASWMIFYSLRSLFGGSAWPSLKTTVVIFFLELLHSFGLALLLFRVLPRTDMIRGLVLMSSICIIPGLFKTISIAKSADHSRVTRILLTIVNGLAFLIQLVSIPVMIMLGFLVTTRSKADIQQTVFSDEDVYNVVRRPGVQPDFTDICWELPVALFCISLVYWENYIDGDLTVGSLHIPFAKWKKGLYLIRERLYIFVGIWKIAWTMIFALFLLPGFNFNMFFPGMNETRYDNAPASSNAQSLSVAALSGDKASGNTTNIGDALNIPPHVQNHFEYFGPLYVQMVSSLCCSFLGSLACKLCMQHVAFSLPLFLATPVSFTVILMQCYYNWIPPYVNAYIWFCPETQGDYLTYHLLWLGAVWISHMIITSHIWLPKSDRMTKLDKLFVAPLRCGILTDTSLLLRRRWNDKDLTLFRSDNDEEDDESMHKANDVIPMIYATATMWHETRNEMTQLLKSLFRMDADHSARSLAQTYYNIKDPDYYEFEAHIFFDDAMELTDDDILVPNSFVAELVDCVDDALSSVHERQMYLGPAARTPTPYGGRLTWRLPGGTRLNVHLKDKHKIRHKKRWSQVMYMYYLLGFRIFALPTDNVKTSTEKSTGEQQEGGKRVRLTASQLRQRRQAAHFTRSVIFNYVDEDVHTQAENTYLLTLDGDVDFKPDAVRLLVDRLKKNKKVGAACGRIHPTGSGPICWYQEFEYAIGHWLQKATEHVFGCVLCAPGCFSLFRGSALVDDNVARTYAIRATEAGHYVQYDQGEDRWLSTLLLQQGYRIEYCAAADALTHAPETFSEFFNQRRRWGPSTLANVIDLLGNWKNTVAINDNISTPYIMYQFFILVSTVLGPATVMLMMAGAFNVVLKTDVMGSYALSLTPPIIFMLICFFAKPGAQLVVASLLSALYAIVMMIVIVGTVANAIEGSITSPNVIFLVMLVGIFIVAALMHPEEVLCIIPGALYFICIPTGYLVLTIYYLCNMHIVSWGTREVPKRKSREEIAEEKIKEEEKRKKKQDRKGIFGWLGLNSIFHEMAEMFRQLRTYTVNNNKSRTDTLLEELVIELRHSRNLTGKMASTESLKLDTKDESVDLQPTVIPRTGTVAPWLAKEDPENPGWINHEIAGCGPIHKLDNKEMAFWTQLSKKYLHPIVEDKQHQEKMDRDLKNLRNNVVFGFFMTSSLWIALSLQLEILQEELKDTLFFQIPRLDPNRKPLTFEPLGLLFLSFFAVIICFQFIGMLIHRWGTILHVLAITDVSCGSKLTKADEVRDIIRQTMELQRVSNIENEPEPDYDEPIPDYEAGDDYEDESSSFYTTVTESDVTPPSYHTQAEARMMDKQRKREIFNRRGFATGRTLRKAFLKRYRRMRQDEIRDDRTDYSMTTRSRYTENSVSTVAPSRMTSRSRPSILPQYNDPNRQTM